MYVTVTATLAEGDELLPMTSDEAAAAVLAALKGDPKKDTCQFTLVYTPPAGVAGVPPETP
jgi:hypothetical protein